MKQKHNSKSEWLRRHFKDPYVKLAQLQGERSRAVFKLKQVQEKDHLLKRGMTVVDLGAAPGGWSKFASEIVGPAGHVVAIDCLPMNPLPGVLILQGDFTDPLLYEELRISCPPGGVDVVLSDIAPNFSGHKSSDCVKTIALAELALEFAQECLKLKGSFLVKVFHGEGFDAFLKAMKTQFAKVVVRKPPASRAESREVYLLGRQFQGKLPLERSL